MSLSNPKVSNPCKKFIEFKGDSGIFQHWDKATEKNIILKYPISFIVLDELCTISGFSDETKSGIYSNEVRSLKDQILNVRSFKGGMKIVGKYDAIKGDIKSAGGKFCKSVYAALIHGDDLELVNFQLKGISFKSWVDKVVDTSLDAIKVEKCDDGKKGNVEYKIPIYESAKVSRELMAKAVLMDKALQEYLAIYQKNNETELVQQHPEVEPQASIEDEDIPF